MQQPTPIQLQLHHQIQQQQVNEVKDKNLMQILDDLHSNQNLNQNHIKNEGKQNNNGDGIAGNQQEKGQIVQYKENKQQVNGQIVQYGNNAKNQNDEKIGKHKQQFVKYHQNNDSQNKVKQVYQVNQQQMNNNAKKNINTNNQQVDIIQTKQQMEQQGMNIKQNENNKQHKQKQKQILNVVNKQKQQINEKNKQTFQQQLSNNNNQHKQQADQKFIVQQNKDNNNNNNNMELKIHIDYIDNQQNIIQKDINENINVQNQGKQHQKLIQKQVQQRKQQQVQQNKQKQVENNKKSFKNNLEINIQQQEDLGGQKINTKPFYQKQVKQDSKSQHQQIKSKKIKSQYKSSSSQQEEQQQQNGKQLQNEKLQASQKISHRNPTPKYKNINPQPISLTQQNQLYIPSPEKSLKKQQIIGKDNKIIQFVQYQPKNQKVGSQKKKKQIDVDNQQQQQDSEQEQGSDQDQQQKQQKNNVQYQDRQRNAKVGPSNQNQYDHIQNQILLKRIQQLQQTVKQLKKSHKQKKLKSEHQNQNQQQKIARLTPSLQSNHEQKIASSHNSKKLKKLQIIHDQSVHGLVSQLSKNETKQTGIAIKKPILQQIRYKKKRIDISALMQKNLTLASNIFNLAIGEIFDPIIKIQQQKQSLRKQIRLLRQKVVKLQQQKRSNHPISQRQTAENRRQSVSTGKKSICGKLVRVSQLKASRAFDPYQTESPNLYNNNNLKADQKQDQFISSQRDSMLEGSFANGGSIKKNIISATQRQVRQIQKDNDSNNNGIVFRVRKPSNKTNQQGNISSFIVQPNQNSTQLKNQSKQTQKISIQPTTNLRLKSNKKQQSKQLKQWYQQPFIQNIELPQLPSPPTQFDSQQDLYTLGKLTFIAFNINVDNTKQMNVKKYKNCVYFNFGEFNNILWYFDGRFYFGEWRVHVTGEGEKSGKGFQFVPQKFIYKGQFKQGKRNGYGRMKLLNKQKDVIYQGNWVDGNKCGEGKQIDEYKIKYWGNWKDNKRQGFGRLKLQDGDLYQGNFQRGIKTGFGKQYFKNGDKYEGNYASNKFHEKGKYIWKNGSVYQGDFINGIRSGHGKWRSNQNNQQYDQYIGDYENDKKNGFGVYKWADGSEYEGYFKDDLKQGQGTIRYKNGKVAKLLWKNGQPLKKIFSQEEKKYRETQKSLQKNNSVMERNNQINKSKTYSSRNFKDME